MRRVAQPNPAARGFLAAGVLLPIAAIALLAHAGEPACTPTMLAATGGPVTPVAAPVAAVTVDGVAMPEARTIAPAGDELAPLGNPTGEGVLGDVLVHVDGAAAAVPLVVTRTQPDGATAVLERADTDALGTARLPRRWFGDAAGVPCIDLAFPTLGACAAQVASDAARVDTWLPPLASLRVRVCEADGSPLLGTANVTLRVVTATPPADREHTWPTQAGAVTSVVEACGLQLVLQAMTSDGRRSEPLHATGPQHANVEALFELRLPDRPRFHLQLREPDGGQPAITSVQVLAQHGARRWPLAVAHGDDGAVTLVAPAKSPMMPVQLQLVVHLTDGTMLVGRHDAALHAFADKDLGTVLLEPAACLARGRCVDAANQPAAGQRLVVLSQQPQHGATAPVWREVPGATAVVAADGSFVVHGPQAAGHLRIVALGHDATATDVPADGSPIELRLPKRRTGWRS